DAGALAGARAFCFSSSQSVTQKRNQAIAAGQSYAVSQNGADVAVVTVDGTTGDVKVDASITFDTFFLGVLGQPELTAVASATAACTPASSAFVLPIAYSCQKPLLGEGEEDTDYCSVKDWDDFDGIQDCNLNTGDAALGKRGDYIYIVVDSTETGEQVVCYEPNGSIPADPPSGTIRYVDCNFDNDDDNDVELLSGGNKSWLDLGGTGGSKPQMEEWITKGLSHPILAHTWFSGQPGAVADIYRTLNTETKNTQVVVPVFDRICHGYPNTTCPLQMDAADTVVTPSETASLDYYHVVSFALFYPTCVEAAGIPGSCPINDLLGLRPQVKSVEGCFISGFDPNLGGGGGTVDTGADVVYLKK
ncbi:MAG TPA: hypothetical protein DEH22_15730, partial [Chloroflexi bacterium]|nr:hypothetical protein [Chloroflexota bacterium]